MNSYQDYRDDVLSREDYMTYVKICEKKLQNAQQRKTDLKDKIASQQDVVDTYENPWITKFRETGQIEKLDRDIVEEMIDKIYIYEDKRIKIVYNFSDELKILNVQD